MINDNLTAPVHQPPVTILRATPLGELFSLLLAVVGAMGAVIWIPLLAREPGGVIFVMSGLWLAYRSFASTSPPWLSPLLSVSLVTGLVAALGHHWPACPGWLTLGLFGPRAFVVMLSVQLAVDVADSWKYHVQLRHWLSTIRWNPFRVALCGFAMLLTTYLVLMPAAWAIMELISPAKVPSTGSDELSLAEQIRIRTTSVVIASWFFALGAAIGSYLNVVAYRIPLRKSLIREPSSCPTCQTPINRWDNIPILGWLLLGGRCRSCQTNISVRYPIVEFVSGCLFLLLYHFELLSGGANLPVRVPNSYTGVVWIIFYTKWDLIAYYGFHCFYFAALGTWFLIAYDANRLPIRSAATAIGLALIAVLAYPDLHLVAALGYYGNGFPSRLEGMIAALTGMLCGAIIGYLVWWRVRWTTPELPRYVIAPFLLTGAVFGWQAALAIATLSLIVQWIWTLVSPSCISAAAQIIGSVIVAALVQLLVWRLTATSLYGWWPGPQVGVLCTVAWAGLFAAMLLFLRRPTTASLV